MVKELEELELKYMLTGSLASSLQGEPRATHDIDLVVELKPDATKRLVQAFPQPYFYLSEERVQEAAHRGTMFNLIDVTSGDKVDFWPLTEDPFDQSRFARRRAEKLFDGEVLVSSPEDTILMKLRWAKASDGSEKQFRDALRVFEVQYGTLDRDYLRLWVERLQLRGLWQRLQGEAEPL